MPDSNGSSTTLQWLDLQTNQSIQLTRPEWGVNDQQYFWLKKNVILFLSNRALSGLNQIFQVNLPDDISTVKNFLEPVQITDYPLDLDNLLIDRQGTQLAFSCQVFANLSIAETVQRQAAEKATGVFAYKFDKLFIRHWDEFMLGRRNHPFLVPIVQKEKGTYRFVGEPVDVLLPLDSDSPTRPFGSAKPQWAFNAKGTKFAFTRQHDETSAVAWSTNLDIYTVDLPATKGKAPDCITCENLAADTDPSFSPVDDNVLVYRAQTIPGYESDQFKIRLHNGQSERCSRLTLLSILFSSRHELEPRHSAGRVGSQHSSDQLVTRRPVSLSRTRRRGAQRSLQSEQSLLGRRHHACSSGQSGFDPRCEHSSHRQRAVPLHSRKPHRTGEYLSVLSHGLLSLADHSQRQSAGQSSPQ